MRLKELGNRDILNKNTRILLLIIIIRRKKANIHRIGNTAIAVCGTYFADGITYFILRNTRHMNRKCAQQMANLCFDSYTINFTNMHIKDINFNFVENRFCNFCKLHFNINDI